MGAVKKIIRKYPLLTVAVVLIVSSSAIGLTWISKAKNTALSVVNGVQS